MKHNHSAFLAVAGYNCRDKAEDRIRRFLPMVHKAAWHIHGGGRDGLEVEDLVQAGLVVLTECARRHTGDTEDGFAAYAKIRVRGAMFDLVRRTLPGSRNGRRRHRLQQDARDQLRQELGREPVQTEVAERLCIDVSVLADQHSQPVHITSLDDGYDDHAPGFADDAPDAFTLLSQDQDGQLLTRAISTLAERQQLVLQLYFIEEMNLAEIAAILEVSVPRVHQIKASALNVLKKILEP
ncbi:sigma-70 family RNA polymerase sigma factor [Croceicoccus sp. F390]|uniref:Sigma-70 family RNA polymerase sigma factor n=1 Tax=Croceicoccus esteveae TaxID=3075597 RepID=A0ABU2ZDN6_9SPHN|nr:sigma-70 family RNA polymerase sigma factor [Croceicoccus sp. F390]MDT0574715.1 sigma-70 family RNA polymerase sigma factor [Croceicoccus sp. F390]